MPDDRYCGSKKRSGGLCERPAGWGTEHAGTGRCKLHGGSTTNHQLSAAKQIAIVMGEPEDIEPHDALIRCVQIASGQVTYCSMMVASLTDEQVIAEQSSTLERPLKEEKGAESLSTTVVEVKRSNTADLHIWIRAQQGALDRLARFAKMALDAGVAERQVRVVESFGGQIAQLMSAVLKRLELTPAQAQRAPAIVRAELTALEAGEPEKVAA